jgi:hypothetical protein
MPWKGQRRLVPCFWLAQTGSAPVGSGPLRAIRPLCLLALDTYGLLAPNYQTNFENALDKFLKKRASRYPRVAGHHSLLLTKRHGRMRRII